MPNARPPRPAHLLSYPFRQSDRFFFDANIWLSIYGPAVPAAKYRSEQYSLAFKNILNSGATIETTPLILSEFLNVCLQFDFKLYGSGGNFKHFRASEAGRAAAAVYGGFGEQILADSTLRDLSITTDEMNDMLQKLGEGNLDVNDLLILHHCRQHQLVLVTDDFDFDGCDIALLSENAKFFPRPRTHR